MELSSALNKKTGRMEFDPVDPSTTDEQRGIWDVPPIEESLKKFEARRPPGA